MLAPAAVLPAVGDSPAVLHRAAQIAAAVDQRAQRVTVAGPAQRSWKGFDDARNLAIRRKGRNRSTAAIDRFPRHRVDDARFAGEISVTISRNAHEQPRSGEAG